MTKNLQAVAFSLMLFATLLFNVKTGQAQTVIASWNMFGQTNFGTSPLAPTVLNDDVTATTPLTRSAGFFTTNYSATIGPNRWGGRTRSADASASVSTNRLITFGFTPKPNIVISFSKISTIPIFLSTASPKTFRVDYSINGGTYVVITTHIITGITGGSNQIIPETDLSGIAALQNVPSTTTVTFRILPYNASSTDDNFNYFYIGAHSGVVGSTTAAIDATAFSVEGTIVNTLPVKLSSFTSSIQNQAALLNWATESEVNFDYFSIEKRGNNSEFKEIGRVPAKGGNTKTLYNFSDRNISFETNYYRLKMVDKDGTFEYSNIVTETLESSAQKLSIYPNPVVNQVAKVQFKSLSAKSTLKVVDVLGKIVLNVQLEAGTNTTDLDLSKITSGQYMLLLESNGAKVDYLKFVK
jgi:hypothetical protein